MTKWEVLLAILAGLFVFAASLLRQNKDINTLTFIGAIVFAAFSFFFIHFTLMTPHKNDQSWNDRFYNGTTYEEFAKRNHKCISGYMKKGSTLADAEEMCRREEKYATQKGEKRWNTK